MSPPPAEKVKVLFIGGYSRSGSTLLDCMLGQLPGVFSTGELAYIWTHGVGENRLCGCGERFLECGFWREVGRLGHGDWSSIDLDAMLDLERTVNRHRFVPLLLRPGLSPAYERNLRRYTEVLGSIYRAIQQVSGARMIVDSTIDPAYGFLLRHVPGLDVRLVHLVRDSRATAFSWTRWQRRTDRVDAVMYQRRFHPASTAMRWSLYHLLIHALGRTGPRPILVRYEQVVDSPREELFRIMRHAEEPIDPDMLGFVAPSEVTLGVNHTLAGSLVRLRRGPLPIHVDDEWRHALSLRHRLTATVLSWPLLVSYGYLANAGMTGGALTAGRRSRMGSGPRQGA